MKIKNLFVTCALLLLTVALGCSGRDSVQAAKPQQAAPVTVAAVESKTMPVLLQAIGNVEAASTVTIKAQISVPILKDCFDALPPSAHRAQVLDDGPVERLFAGKMPEEQRLIYACLLGYLPRGGPLKTLAGKQTGSHLQNLLATINS